jgi:hypothetical protein
MSRLRWRNAGRAEMNGSGRAIRGGGACEAAVVATEAESPPPSCLTIDGLCDIVPGNESDAEADAVGDGTGLLKSGDVYDRAWSNAGPSSAGAKNVGKKLLMSAIAGWMLPCRISVRMTASSDREECRCG